MDDDETIMILQLTRDGIWANPDIPADEAAKKVLSALDVEIKQMVSAALDDVKNERDEYKRYHEAETIASNRLFEQLTAFQKSQINLLLRIEQEMRYAGWGERQADNPQRSELYADLCNFLGER